VMLLASLEVFKTTRHGTNLHYVNRCVEVEQNETPFDY
jgi:hypothetical protein